MFFYSVSAQGLYRAFRVFSPSLSHILFKLQSKLLWFYSLSYSTRVKIFPLKRLQTLPQNSKINIFFLIFLCKFYWKQKTKWWHDHKYSDFAMTLQTELTCILLSLWKFSPNRNNYFCSTQLYKPNWWSPSFWKALLSPQTNAEVLSDLPSGSWPLLWLRSFDPDHSDLPGGQL